MKSSQKLIGRRLWKPSPPNITPNDTFMKIIHVCYNSSDYPFGKCSFLSRPFFAPIAATLYNVGHLSFCFVYVILHKSMHIQKSLPHLPSFRRRIDFEYVGAITHATKLTLLT